MVLIILGVYVLSGIVMGIVKFISSKNSSYTLNDLIFSIIFGGVLAILSIVIFIIEAVVTFFICTNNAILFNKPKDSRFIYGKKEKRIKSATTLKSYQKDLKRRKK